MTVVDRSANTLKKIWLSGAADTLPMPDTIPAAQLDVFMSFQPEEDTLSIHYDTN